MATIETPQELSEMVERWKRDGYLARCMIHGDQVFRFNETEDRFDCPAQGSVAFEDCRSYAKDGRANHELELGVTQFANADKWGGYDGGKPRDVNR